MRLLAWALLLALTASAAAAQHSQPLRIGTKEAPPFAIKRDDGSWTGLAIELWKATAREHEWRYELVELDLETLLDDTASGKLDAAVGAFTVTADREMRLDFSQPFHSSGLGIALPCDEELDFWRAAKQFPLWPFLKILFALLATLLIAGALVWFFERERNAEQFGGRGRGLMSGMWFSAVTLTTVGYGDKAPRTLGGRSVALVWMFISLFVIAAFTATMASTLTTASIDARVRGLADLHDARVGTLAATMGDAYVRNRGITPEPSATLPEALDQLAAGELDVVVHDAPILRYVSAGAYAERILVLPNVLTPFSYAIMLPEESPLTEPLDQFLLRTVGSEDWQDELRRYLGT